MRLGQQLAHQPRRGACVDEIVDDQHALPLRRQKLRRNGLQNA